MLEHRGRLAEVGMIIRFICGKLIVVFHCSPACCYMFLSSGVGTMGAPGTGTPVVPTSLAHP